MSLIVTPEVLRTTQQATETALQHAASIANGYEGIGSAVWGGQAQLASVNTAGQINLELQQMITGGTRLAHGLSQAASMNGTATDNMFTDSGRHHSTSANIRQHASASRQRTSEIQEGPSIRNAPVTDRQQADRSALFIETGLRTDEQ